MNTRNRFAASRQDSLAATELCDQLELPPLLFALQTILKQLPTGALTTFHPTRRAIRAKQAYAMTGDGRSQFWARQNPNDPAWDPTFPRAFKLGDSPRSATVWFADEIEAWLETRADVSSRHALVASGYGRRKHSIKIGDTGSEVTS